MTEQRKSQRFNLKFPLELVRVGAAALNTRGETRNLSSNGVLFTTTTGISIGESIEYQISLPQDVRLKCVGKVVRSDRDDMFAATLERYEFQRQSARMAPMLTDVQTALPKGWLVAP
ncbi:MAG: PilZ domain-containing protein [Bryobacteraceae bacterium]